MSKQSEAKEKQNYQAKPLARRCRTCKHLISTPVEKWGYGMMRIGEKLCCGIGGFKVTANAVCDLFEGKR